MLTEGKRVHNERTDPTDEQAAQVVLVHPSKRQWGYPSIDPLRNQSSHRARRRGIPRSDRKCLPGLGVPWPVFLALLACVSSLSCTGDFSSKKSFYFLKQNARPRIFEMRTWKQMHSLSRMLFSLLALPYGEQELQEATKAFQMPLPPRRPL